MRVGLYGPSRASAWVTTSTEALYAWDWAAACDEITEGVRLCRPRLPWTQEAQGA